MKEEKLTTRERVERSMGPDLEDPYGVEDYNHVRANMGADFWRVRVNPDRPAAIPDWLDAEQLRAPQAGL